MSRSSWPHLDPSQGLNEPFLRVSCPPSPPPPRCFFLGPAASFLSHRFFLAPHPSFWSCCFFPPSLLSLAASPPILACGFHWGSFNVGLGCIFHARFFNVFSKNVVDFNMTFDFHMTLTLMWQNNDFALTITWLKDDASMMNLDKLLVTIICHLMYIYMTMASDKPIDRPSSKSQETGHFVIW